MPNMVRRQWITVDAPHFYWDFIFHMMIIENHKKERFLNEFDR